jgi:predicted kinase
MILSPDHFLIDAEGNYSWSPLQAKTAWAATERRVKEFLADPRYKKLVLLVGVPGAGKSTWLRQHADPFTIYVDATFTLKMARRPFVELAQQVNKQVEVFLFETPFEQCCRRNDQRSADRKVPLDKMIKFRDQLVSEPPTLEEGFSQVVRVPA